MNKNIKKLRISLISLITLILLSACWQNTQDSTSINHIVLVWLKVDTTPTELETIIKATQQLKNIEGIQSLSIGRSLESERKIVDDSFSLGIHMRFKDKTAMQAYLSHPQHVKFVDTMVKPKLEKIVVYDF
jgi:lipoprotein NlpI